jgi:hypothetical protein
VESTSPDEPEIAPPDQPVALTEGVAPPAWSASASPPGPAWVAPEPWPSARGAKFLAALVWIAAGLLLAMAGWIAANGQEAASSPWRAGYVAGTVAGGLGIATVIRWVWLKLRRSPTGSATLASIWIPAISVFLAIGMLGTTFARAVEPPPPVDPATLFHVGAGYHLEPGDPATEEQFRRGFDGDAVKPRALDSTSIVADDGSVGLLLVADMAVADLTSELSLMELMAGVGSDANPRRETVAGQSTMFAAAGGISIVGWIDAPLIVILYAVDDPTGRAMAESVIRAND